MIESSGYWRWVHSRMEDWFFVSSGFSENWKQKSEKELKRRDTVGQSCTVVKERHDVGWIQRGWPTVWFSFFTDITKGCSGQEQFTPGQEIVLCLSRALWKAILWKQMYDISVGDWSYPMSVALDRAHLWLLALFKFSEWLCAINCSHLVRGTESKRFVLLHLKSLVPPPTPSSALWPGNRFTLKIKWYHWNWVLV